MTEPITIQDSKRLIQLEKVIGDGVKGVGEALIAIRDEKLYRAEYGTFEDYCKGKWQMGKAYAYRLIEFTEIKKSPVGDKISNERQAREIAKAPTEKRAQVVSTAAAKAESEDRPMTARDVKEAVLEVCEPDSDGAKNGARPVVEAGVTEAPSPLPTDHGRFYYRNRHTDFIEQITKNVNDACGCGTDDQVHALKVELELSIPKIGKLIKDLKIKLKKI